MSKLDTTEDFGSFMKYVATELQAFAKHIVETRENPRGAHLPDHGCGECVPGGDLVKDDFQCVYHRAKELLARLEDE